MPLRTAEPRPKQTELAFDAPERGGATPSTVDPRPRGKRSRQRPQTDGSLRPSAATGSTLRTTRSTGRPLQPVPRLLLSRKEAAASLGMSLDTFERRVQPVIKLVPCGQLVLVPLRELERWCDDHAHYLAGAV